MTKCAAKQIYMFVVHIITCITYYWWSYSQNGATSRLFFQKEKSKLYCITFFLMKKKSHFYKGIKIWRRPIQRDMSLPFAHKENKNLEKKKHLAVFFYTTRDRLLDLTIRFVHMYLQQIKDCIYSSMHIPLNNYYKFSLW